MSGPLRVGIIGASAERGWAKVSHVPAIQSLEGLKLVAVATQDNKSARAASEAFGVKGFSSAMALINDPDVDIVAIAVKVPNHRELVLAAVDAQKNIYCEWPLGKNLTEANELAAAVRRPSLKAAIGLQTRCNPNARHARMLIESGAIGRALSANILSTAAAFGPTIEKAMVFAERADNGVTLVTVQGAHTIDLAIAVLGSFDDATALLTTQYPQVCVEGGPRMPRSTPDHMILQGRLQSGCAVSIETAGGRPANATPFRFEITGELGTLVLIGGAPRGFQSGRLRLILNGIELSVDQGAFAGIPDTAANVAALYSTLRDDIVNGTSDAPNFEHAVSLTQVVDDLIASSSTGMRRRAIDWPAR